MSLYSPLLALWARTAGLSEDRIIILGNVKEADCAGDCREFPNSTSATRPKRININPKKDPALLVYSSGTRPRTWVTEIEPAPST
jgi:hypothetical protein